MMTRSGTTNALICYKQRIRGQFINPVDYKDDRTANVDSNGEFHLALETLLAKSVTQVKIYSPSWPSRQQLNVQRDSRVEIGEERIKLSRQGHTTSGSRLR